MEVLELCAIDPDLGEECSCHDGCIHREGDPLTGVPEQERANECRHDRPRYDESLRPRWDDRAVCLVDAPDPGRHPQSTDLGGQVVLPELIR